MHVARKPKLPAYSMPAAATETGTPRARRQTARALHGLYAVTPDLADTRDLVARAEAAIAGGACAIQYRNKSAPAALQREQAEVLAHVCTKRGVPLIINDDPHLARAVGAAGVHVGEADGGLAAARAIVGDDMLVGVSCYDDFALAQRLVADGADYVAFGSFFPSAVKPGARRADITLLARGRSLPVPVVAIGGITAAGAGELAAAGADAVAVISAVFGAVEPTAVARAAADIQAQFNAHYTRPPRP